MAIVRYASPEDAGTVYRFISELEHTTFNEQLFLNYFNSQLKNPDKIHLIAEWEELPVGYLSCYGQILLHHLGMVFEIQEMYIDPAGRNKGLGKEMIAFLRQELQSKNCLSLEVTTKLIRADAIRFYESCGFQKTHCKLTIDRP